MKHRRPQKVKSFSCIHKQRPGVDMTSGLYSDKTCILVLIRACQKNAKHGLSRPCVFRCYGLVFNSLNVARRFAASAATPEP